MTNIFLFCEALCLVKSSELYEEREISVQQKCYSGFVIEWFNLIKKLSVHSDFLMYT